MVIRFRHARFRPALLALLLVLAALAPGAASAAPVGSAEIAPTVTPPVAPAARVAGWTGFERKVLKQTNKARRNHGCRALRADKHLRKTARTHSRAMADAETMSHQLPGEANLGNRITKAGYRGWRGLAENVAYGYPRAKALVQAWMKSPGHRRNILNCTYRHLGVGVVTKDGTPWATQNFGHK